MSFFLSELLLQESYNIFGIIYYWTHWIPLISHWSRTGSIITFKISNLDNGTWSTFSNYQFLPLHLIPVSLSLSLSLSFSIFFLIIINQTSEVNGKCLIDLLLIIFLRQFNDESPWLRVSFNGSPDCRLQFSRNS